MNIVLGTPQFFPDVYGGVETYTLALAKEFKYLGHTVHVICTRQGTPNSEVIAVEDDSFDSINVRRIIYDSFSRPQKYHQTMYDPVIAQKVAEALQEWNADLIHITNFSRLSAAVISVARQVGIPIVWTATDFGNTCARFNLLKWDGTLCPGLATFCDCFNCVRPRSPRNNQIYNLLSKLPEDSGYYLAQLAEKTPFKRFGVFRALESIKQRLDLLLPLLPQIDLIIAPSTWMKEILVMNGADPDRIAVSVYGLQIAQEHPCPRIAHTPVRFGFMGRIHPMKGVDVLIDAFNQLDDPKDATLTIYGSPNSEQFEYAGQLWSMAKSNPRISLGRQIAPNQITETLTSFDVLVVPSIWYENSPITILEALYCRIPVIASQVAGIVNLVQHNVNGLLFERADVKDLVIQMQRIIDQPELVNKFSTQIVSIKDIGNDAKLLLEQYTKLCSLSK